MVQIKMESYIQSVEMDFGRVIALWEMCEYPGSDNEDLEEFSRENFTAGSLVSYSSMIAELIITIGRLLDSGMDRNTKQYNSYSIISMLDQFKKAYEENKEKQDAVNVKIEQFYSIRKSTNFTEIIRQFRNKCLAHTDIGFNMKKGDIKSLFQLCDEIECFIKSLGFDLGIEIDISSNYHRFWRKEAKKYWSALRQGVHSS